ncbi:hypothetical protein VIGAN_01485700 [Vigna angularis var. angularis]|uniref:Uncharacterized protein n=1 Tax=Vigna angularis var. angularis TaxID=157739 RepID=A0A0S3R8B0_PHAAN|nr:hypothetical protein VIGAN_01485700 [Vigna angularis var. angularis]
MVSNKELELKMEMQQHHDEEQHLDKQWFEVMEKGMEYLKNDEKIDIIEETMDTQVDMCSWLDLQIWLASHPKRLLNYEEILVTNK